MARRARANISEDDWVSVKVDIAEIKKDVAYIRKVIDGNGKEGIVGRVNRLEKDMAKIMAIAGLLGASVGTIVTVVLKFFGL